jgi:hypothetical protein
MARLMYGRGAARFHVEDARCERRSRIASVTPLVLLATLLAAWHVGCVSAVHAESNDAPGAVRVERIEPRDPKRPTLVFLKANRDFFRTQLDFLRMKAAGSAGGAVMLDERTLALRELIDEIGRDHARASEAGDHVGRAELLATVEEMAAFDAEIAAIESLLTRQETRMDAVARDFLGDEITELIVLFRAGAGARSLASIEIEIDGEVREALAVTEVERRGFERGGIAEIERRLAEPRAHEIRVRARNEQGVVLAEEMVTVEAARGQMTFVEFAQGGGADAAAPQELATRTWTQ